MELLNSVLKNGSPLWSHSEMAGILAESRHDKVPCLDTEKLTYSAVAAPSQLPFLTFEMGLN